MLDKRLSAVASLVRDEHFLCDIGTDHGFLPCSLVKNKRISQCIACDINEKPLDSARTLVEQMGFTEQIQLLLSDGLCGVPHEVEDIVIAGMGGELIISILSKADFVKNVDIRLILQPMTNAPLLRSWLYTNGFEILTEIPVTLKRHIYTVLHVAYCGKSVELSPVQATLGKVHASHEGRAYVEWQLSRVQEIIDGLNRSVTRHDELDKYRELERQIMVVRKGINVDEKS